LVRPLGVKLCITRQTVDTNRSTKVGKNQKGKHDF